MAESKQKNYNWYLKIYRNLLLVRRFEEKLDELFMAGKIAGTLHNSIGQEAIAVGVREALGDNDLVVGHHRSHGHCIMQGADVKRMMAEILGKSTGLCKGKGGSMHIIDVKNGMLGAMGIVASGIPIAAGVGKAIKLKKTGQVCVCYFGDDASNNGSFHEGLNIASLWQLPIIFICENNGYGLSVSQGKTTAVTDIAIRGKSYNIPGTVVDGMDPEMVYDAAKKAIFRARAGKGPSLLECKTYRYLGHSRGDPSYGPYRTKDEWESWKNRDPLITFPKAGKLKEEDLDRVDREITLLIGECVRFAEESPNPDVRTALEDNYA